MHRALRSERGMTMVFTAVAMTAFLAFAVVGVDLGRLALTATEVQTVADAAATAGIRALLENQDAVGQAQTVAAQNKIDGKSPSIPAQNIQVGSYDRTANTFVAGGVPQNAVRATAGATVQNLMAAVLGSAATTVTKTATAAFGGVDTSDPVLPIAIGDCNFTAFQTSLQCGQLPSLKQVPKSSNNSGWTSLSNAPASTAGISTYLPLACGGGGQQPATLKVGDSINVTNGQNNPLLTTISTCVSLGFTTYRVPVVPCGAYNKSMPILGFATITISKVKTKGKKKGIDLSVICNTNARGAGNGGLYGTLSVAMVQ